MALLQVPCNLQSCLEYFRTLVCIYIFAVLNSWIRHMSIVVQERFQSPGSCCILCCGHASNVKIHSVLLRCACFTQDLVEYYKQYSLKEGFSSLDTTLQVPYRELSNENMPKAFTKAGSGECVSQTSRLSGWDGLTGKSVHITSDLSSTRSKQVLVFILTCLESSLDNYVFWHVVSISCSGVRNKGKTLISFFYLWYLVT